MSSNNDSWKKIFPQEPLTKMQAEQILSKASISPANMPGQRVVWSNLTDSGLIPMEEMLKLLDNNQRGMVNTAMAGCKEVFSADMLDHILGKGLFKSVDDKIVSFDLEKMRSIAGVAAPQRPAGGIGI